MKKIAFSAAAFILFTAAVFSQTAKDVFNAKEIVWYGMDFTNAKFVGQFDQGFGVLPVSGEEMKSTWIPAWNALIDTEQQNFDLKKAFHTNVVYYDPKPVNEMNNKIDAGKCMSLNPGTIEKSTIDAIVKEYGPGEKKEGIGAVFIVEDFNKGTDMAAVYVTFFDIASKKVLITEKMSGKAIGIGMRNYWAGAVKAILKQVSVHAYADWKSKYSS